MAKVWFIKHAFFTFLLERQAMIFVHAAQDESVILEWLKFGLVYTTALAIFDWKGLTDSNRTQELLNYDENWPHFFQMYVWIKSPWFPAKSNICMYNYKSQPISWTCQLQSSQSFTFLGETEAETRLLKLLKYILNKKGQLYLTFATSGLR